MDTNSPWHQAVEMFVGGAILRIGILSVALFWLAEKTGLGASRRIWDRAIPDGQLKKEILATMLILIFDAVVLFPDLLWFHWFPHADSNGWNDLLTFVTLFLWIEIYYYATHRAMHHPKLYWLHRRHHDSKRTTVFSSYSMSFGERGVLLAGILLHGLLGFVMPITVNGVTAYFLFNFVYSILIHSNVEWFSPGRFFISPKFHADHHRYYNLHFGLFIPQLDQWFKTDRLPPVASKSKLAG